MEYVKTTTVTRNIKSIKYPWASKESILRIRNEKTCYFCKKKYKDSEYFGITMSDKGSKICCDDCCVKIGKEVKVYT